MIEFLHPLLYTDNKYVMKSLEEYRLMHMPEIQAVLNEKNIAFSYVEEDNCGSIDFEHRGLRYHIWEYADDAEPVAFEERILIFDLYQRKCVL